MVCAVGMLGGVGTAQATVTEFSAGISADSRPEAIAAGPDGNLWFTEPGGPRIGRITPVGNVTEFAGVLSPCLLTSIVAGPDGNLWFTEWFAGQIGRITPSGEVTEFSAGITADIGLADIAAGPDGNLWFTEPFDNKIGRITPSGTVTEFSAGITAGSGPWGITAGPDGNVWFTEMGYPDRLARIGRITPTGTVTEFSAGLTPYSSPSAIVTGPDGNLWFTEDDQIGRITPSGRVTEFSAGITPYSHPNAITAGPDGNLWFTEPYGPGIGRITPSGTISEFSVGSTSNSAPTDIAAGADGNLWFTESQGNRIGRITPDSSPSPRPRPPPPPPPPPSPQPSGAPVVLVGGLAEDNPLVLPRANGSETNCALLNDFRKLCVSLTRAGHPVYVMPGSKGSKSADVLDTTGAVFPNARKLANFIQTFVPAPPLSRAGPPALVVGHSMGGLIAHAAISLYGARAGGLFTIGTPHTGSYGADLALGILDAPCSPIDPACIAVKAAAATMGTLKGTTAVADLTSRVRRAENQVLRPPGVKTWVFAGTACTYPFTSDEYWSPNDGIVGLSSALGRGASLGTVTALKADLWHTVSGQLLTLPQGLQGSCDPRGFGLERPNEFTDGRILARVKEAADSLGNASARFATKSAALAGASGNVRRPSAPRPTVRAKFALSTARARKLRPGARLPTARQIKLLAARRPFALSCKGKTVQAVHLFDAAVYATKPRLARCSIARLVARRPVAIMVTRNVEHARAALVIRGSKLSITLTGRSAIRSPVLRAGKRRIPAGVRRRGPRRLTLTVRTPRRARGKLTINATIGGDLYSALVPNP